MLGATYVQRHPKTGKYLFRRKVPDHLRPIVGKREITRSLYTYSLEVAKRRSRSLADQTDDLFTKARRLAGHHKERSQDASLGSVEDRQPPTISEIIIENVQERSTDALSMSVSNRLTDIGGHDHGGDIPDHEPHHIENVGKRYEDASIPSVEYRQIDSPQMSFTDSPAVNGDGGGERSSDQRGNDEGEGPSGIVPGSWYHVMPSGMGRRATS